LLSIDARRAQYEAQIAYAATRWRVRVHAHCWLADSALLFVQIGYAPLEQFMHSLRSPFSHFLKAVGISKPYAGRYRASLVDEQEFFFDVVRYMLCRPLISGLSDAPLEYVYSSALVCLGAPIPPFLTRTELPTLMRAHGVDTRLRLMRFLDERPRAGFSVLVQRGSLTDRRVLGRRDFVREVQAEGRQPRIKASPKPCIEWVAQRLGIDSTEILSRPRNAQAVQARALVGWLATCAGAAHISTVARWFGLDRSSLERTIDERLRNAPWLFADQVLEEFCAFLSSAMSGMT
jgi:hypothetical protein